MKVYHILYTTVNFSVHHIVKDIISLFVLYIKRNKTPLKYMAMFCTCTSRFILQEHIEILARFIKRSHVAVWKWIQRYKPEKIARKRKRISGFIIDETHKDWFGLDVDLVAPIDLKTEILALFQLINQKKETCSLLSDLFKFGPDSYQPSSFNRWWNDPQASRFLNVDNHIHSSLEKSLIE